MKIAAHPSFRVGVAVAALVIVGIGVTSATPATAKDKPEKPSKAEKAAKAAAKAAEKTMGKVVGRWNLTVTAPDGVPYPSWVEITREGDKLAGRLCGRFGNAHPLDRVEWNGKEVVLAEAVKKDGKDGQTAERLYKAKLTHGDLEGEITFEGEPTQTFVAEKAPALKPPPRIHLSKPVTLITQGLAGWRLRSDKHAGCWTVTDGVLKNKKPCVDIISDGMYQNFKLHVEFNLGEPNANSGIYLRGRYEVQIEDNAGQPPRDNTMGAVYGLITPKTNPAKPPGEWQAYDITLLGRRITVVLNGETIIDNEEIPGPTGGALDSAEARPGPIMLQGDHGVVAYRNITLTPAM